MATTTLALALTLTAGSLRASSLVLERTIALAGVEGRIDHLALDAQGRRLFVAALGDDTVEVIDLAAGKVVHSITGLAEPQDLAFVPENNRLYVSNGGDGAVRVFDATTFAPVTTVKFDDDADNVRFDAATHRLYVGHGGGALAAIDVATNTVAADSALPAHPESFQLERDGPRVFVNVPGAVEVVVVDRKRRTVNASWSHGIAAGNFAMALDEANHRLFIGSRSPAQLTVIDTQSGEVAAKLELHGDCDDLYFDSARRRLFASCGEGCIDVFARNDGGRFARAETIQTAAGARTCLIAGARLYLAVPKRGGRSAAVWCYRVNGESPSP